MGLFKWLFHAEPLSDTHKSFTIKAGKKKLVGYEQEILLRPANDLSGENALQVVYDKPRLPAPRYVTVLEAGKMFNLPDNFIRNLCRKGKVKGYKQGFKWMVSIVSLESYLSSIVIRRR